MLNRSTLIILVLVAVFAACGLGASVDPLYTDNDTASNTSSYRLNETEWVLTSLNGNSSIEDSTITLAFPYGNDIIGCTGCNYYDGRYTINGNDFNIFVEGRTDFDCDVPESIMQQEAAYFEVLASAAAYQIIDDCLEIDNATGETILTFMIKEEPSIDPNLNETEWVLTSLNGKSPVKESRITLSFAEGTVTGFAGCNHYGGEYTMVDDGALVIPEIAITAQLCLTPKGVMPQEDAYIEALSGAAAYQVMDDRLEVDDAAGETILVFTLKEELLMDHSALEGIEWQLISWNGRSPLEDSTITIAFAAGEISGYAGCRDYAGTYEASGDDIRFTSIGMKGLTDLKPEALLKQEAEYTTNLSLATNYRLIEGGLEIFTAPGGVLIYAPVSEEKTSGDDLEPPLKVAWKYRLGVSSTDIYPQSIDLIASNVIYVNYGWLEAIDVDDGKLLWTKDWSASLAYEDGVLYAARSFSPSLYALDPKTGEEIWRKNYSELEGSYARHNLVSSNNTLYIITKDIHDVFSVLAVDTDGNPKWHREYIEKYSNPVVNSDVMVVIDRDYKQKNLVTLDLKTGEKIWEINDIDFHGKIHTCRDLFFIGHLIENNSVHILAVSQVTGKTVWKRKVGESYGDILAIKNNKLFVNSENIKVLNPENGEILDEYSGKLDSTLLRYFPKAISNNLIYIATTGPSPHIYVFDLNTGELLWKKGGGGLSPYLYKNKLFLISRGKLYAYEHGVEVSKAIYFAIFSIILIITNLFIRRKNCNSKFQSKFQFSTLLTLVAYVWFLLFGMPSFLHFLEVLIPSIDTDWLFYLLFPSISVIAGTMTSMRIKNKFLIGMVAGATPYLIALIASIILYLPDILDFHWFILLIWIPISLAIILLIGLSFGVVSCILNFVLFKISS
jgi:heat shock protein HslJ/outer membrane protein assembly factor BamB